MSKLTKKVRNISESNQNLLTEYSIYLSQNVSPNSIRTTLSALYLISHYDFLTVTSMELLLFRNEYVSKSSQKTSENRIILIKNFFKYLQESNYRQDNPSAILKLPKGEKGSNNTHELISNETYKEIYSDITIPFQIRLAIILGSQCGLRISEVCSLTKNNIDLDEQLLQVKMSKGNKSRAIPMSSTVVNYIQQQLQRNTNSEYLLINKYGEKCSDDYIRKGFNKLRDKYNLGESVVFHSNRHAFATTLVNNPNVSLAVASDVMGHSDWKTTAMYRHSDKQETKKQVLSAIENLF